MLVCYVAYTAKYLTYLLKSAEVIQIWEFDNLHMTQCAKIIVGFMANVSNVFYPTFTNVFFLFSPRFLRFFNVSYFHLNVYYIYGPHLQALNITSADRDPGPLLSHTVTHPGMGGCRHVDQK